jgi:hypothetical protein
MNQIEEMLMKLYWKLWTSADFESDFQKDWLAVYQRMQEGNHYSIPSQIIEMCFQYLNDWERES